MRITTALNHRDHFDRRVADLYSQARTFSWSHDMLLTQLKAQVYDAPAWSRVPAWVRGYVTARGALRLEALYGLTRSAADNHVVWRHRVIGKKALYASWLDIPERRRRDPRKIESAHVWSKTGEPFSDWRPVYE